MAIGYSKIISKYNPAYFDNWLSFIEKKFKLYEGTDNKVIVINTSGDLDLKEVKAVRSIFSDGLSVTLKFRNEFNQFVTCDINCIDKYLVIEDYSMDELLNEEAYTSLYDCLMIRFKELSKESKVSGFIFDVEGYSEDYIDIYRGNR